MKKPLSHKIAGYTLVIFSILGLLFSTTGIVATWVVRSPLQKSFLEVLSSLEETLSNSQDGFTLINQVIDGLLADINILKDRSRALRQLWKVFQTLWRHPRI